MEWEPDDPRCSHTYHGQGRRSPGRRSGWELEFRDCGAIPGRGLLLTVERRTQGMWGRGLWWEMPVEESRAAMEARRYCWDTRSGWSPHHSLSYPTRQHPQQNNREAGPSNDTLNYRVGPQSGGGPSMCLNRQSYGETLAKEDFWSPATFQFSHSMVSDSATPWTSACQASLSITNSWSLLKLMSITSVMPPNRLILCRPLLLLPPIPPNIRAFTNESVLHIRLPKYWSFSLIISPSNEY